MVHSLKDIEARTVATTAKVVALMQAGDRAGAEALLWAEAKPVDFHAKLTHHFHRILTHPDS